MKVLIIDDDKIVVDLCKTFLNLYAVDTVCFERFTDALTILEKGEFDFILLDKTLPDINEDEMLTYLQKLNLSQKIILMTGDAYEYEDELIKNVRTVLLKPFHIEKLKDLLSLKK